VDRRSPLAVRPALSRVSDRRRGGGQLGRR
jgi:hypothetical protein